MENWSTPNGTPGRARRDPHPPIHRHLHSLGTRSADRRQPHRSQSSWGIIATMTPAAQSDLWLQLPTWTNGKTEIAVPEHHSIAAYEKALQGHDRSSAATLRQVRFSAIQRVDLADSSCACSRWSQVGSNFPSRDLRRVCRHIAKAMLHCRSDFAAPWNEWTIRILVAMEREFSYGVPDSYASAFFSNESEWFLAVYDKQRRYVELFGENGGCFGYDGTRNRWAYGEGPDQPLAVKKDLRPWIELLDGRSKSDESG
jgi:hypothetical protein